MDLPFIPYGRQTISDDDIAAVVEVPGWSHIVAAVAVVAEASEWSHVAAAVATLDTAFERGCRLK